MHCPAFSDKKEGDFRLGNAKVNLHESKPALVAPADERRTPNIYLSTRERCESECHLKRTHNGTDSRRSSRPSHRIWTPMQKSTNANRRIATSVPIGPSSFSTFAA